MKQRRANDSGVVAMTGACPQRPGTATTRWLRLARMPLMRLVLVGNLAMLAAMVSGGAESTAYAGPATDAVKVKHLASFTLLSQGTVEADKAFSATEDQLFDYKAMAEASLGNEWAARTESEKALFIASLKPMVRKFYERTLRRLLTYSIQFVAEYTTPGAIVVRTRATPKADSGQIALELNYKLVGKDGVWKCHDLVAEGGSLTARYRSEFTILVKSHGFAALLQRMQDKLGRGDV